MENFDIIYAEGDRAFAERLIQRADAVYKNMIAKFGFDDILMNKMAIVTICESVPKYLEETNKSAEEYEEWMVGNCDFVHGKITILSPEISTTHSEQDLEKVFVHELIHLIFDNFAATLEVPIWCAEGIAVLYAEQIEVGYLDEENYPKIDELLDEETFAENGGYDYAGVYVWYFIERYGFSKFLELYNNSLDDSKLIYNGFEKEAIKKLKEVCFARMSDG